MEGHKVVLVTDSAVLVYLHVAFKIFEKKDGLYYLERKENITVGKSITCTCI